MPELLSYADPRPVVCQMEGLEPRQLLTKITAIPGLVIRNIDAFPANDRLVFNLISNPDTIRRNVVHNVSGIRLTNTTSSPMVLKTLRVVNRTYFRMTGGGENITLAPGASRVVK